MVVGKAGQACALNRADVYKDILAAAVGRNESISFGGIEPFHGASRHLTDSFCNCCPRECGNPAKSYKIE
ncbi:hypothetical protein RV134_390137 [Roseovarius sp. EC-HK134]|nr:hypothetical protein RV420_460207 [Roseovarius sp. EC-SD190]VVT33532.1 hypothetical protein RV134_390137 [Roseovarius sp. EC-HK134]